MCNVKVPTQYHTNYLLLGPVLASRLNTIFAVIGIGEPWLLGQPSGRHEKDSLSWLQSEDLLSVLSTTLSDIHTTVNKAKEDGKSMNINTRHHTRV